MFDHNKTIEEKQQKILAQATTTDPAGCTYADKTIFPFPFTLNGI